MKPLFLLPLLLFTSCSVCDFGLASDSSCERYRQDQQTKYCENQCVKDGGVFHAYASSDDCTCNNGAVK
jgi:hypothetical protein